MRRSIAIGARLACVLAAAACAQAGDHAQRPAPSPNAQSSTAQAPAAAPPSSWQGDSAGWHWSWTAADISATKSDAGKRRTFSLAARLRAEFDHDMQALRADNAMRGVLPCTRETTASVLSIVGSLLSYRTTRETTCAREAHPEGETRFATINLADERENASVVLDALFPQAAVASALREDKLVKSNLPADRAHGSLADLTAALATVGGVVTPSDCFEFPEDLTARFAFHHVDGGRVAVRFGVPGAGPCRTRLTQLGVMLAIPQSLAGPLALAATAQEGLLMSRAETIAANTRWTWREP
jgi:hypothetical protein